MPIRHVDLMRRRGNSVPECFNVVNLLLDGEIIEPRRWYGQCLSHMPRDYFKPTHEPTRKPVVQG